MAEDTGVGSAVPRMARTLRRILEPADHGPFTIHVDEHEDGDLFEQPLAPAAVLVPLVARAAGWQVLLTQRTRHLKHHAGQISFPGGRLERHDGSRVAAALRETEEEIGIVPAAVTVLGRLAPFPTVSGYAVTPIVGIVDADYRLRLDPREVDSAFEVPLDFLLEPANCRRQSALFRGRRRHYYVIQYRRHQIWGATAAILVDLARRLERVASPLP